MKRRLLLFLSLLLLTAAAGMGTGLWQKYQEGKEDYEQAEQIYVRRKTEISKISQDEEEKTERKQKTVTAPITVDFAALRKTEYGCDRVAVHPIHRIELSSDAGRG